MNSAKDAQITEAIHQRATEWFVRHRENPLSASEQHQYLEWLRASPLHVRAYLNLIALTARLPEVVEGLDVDLDALAREVSASSLTAERALFAPERHGYLRARGTRRSGWFATAASILVIVGAAAGVWQWNVSRGRTYTTGEVQQRIVELPDGSKAHLNSSSRLSVRYTETQRLLEMPEGQALFNVVHDPRRPFIVRTANSDVIAVGTQFDVIRRTNSTRVTVVEGRVAVVPIHAPDDPREAEVLLLAGQQVQLADTGAVPIPAPANIQSATAWSRKEVTFASQRLEDVAHEFNRLTGSNIEIQNARLRDHRVSGVFQAYDVESFLAYLAQLDGVRIDRQGDEVTIRDEENFNAR